MPPDSVQQSFAAKYCRVACIPCQCCDCLEPRLLSWAEIFSSLELLLSRQVKANHESVHALWLALVWLRQAAQQQVNSDVLVVPVGSKQHNRPAGPLG